MRKIALALIVLLIANLVVCDISEARRRSPRRHSVRSYTRKDGTRVSAHMRGSGSGSSSRKRSSRSRSYGRSGGYSSIPSTDYEFSAPRYQAPPVPTVFTYPSSPATGELPPAFRKETPTSTQVAKEEITLPSTVTARVVDVGEGDMITVLYQERHRIEVRLYGIDAPEVSQPFGQSSKKKLSDLVLNKEVKLYSKRKDQNGRLLAWVFQGSNGVNKEMVRSGSALWHRQSAPNETGLRDAESYAEQSKLGLWASNTNT